MGTNESTRKRLPKTILSISVLGLVISPFLLIANLALLYHLGDASGNPRTTFGDASVALDEYLVKMQPENAVGLVRISGALLWGSLLTAIFGGLFAQRHSKSQLATNTVVGGLLLALIYIAGVILTLTT